jgi:hypothetical protein
MILPNKKQNTLIGYRLSAGGSDKVMANLSVFLKVKALKSTTSL